MSYIGRADEDSVARELFGRPAWESQSGSYAACFNAFNLAVDRYLTHTLDPLVQIEGLPALSPTQLINVTRILKAQPHITRSKLRDEFLSKPSAAHAPAQHSAYCDAIDKLIDASVHTLLLVKCSPRKGILATLNESRRQASHWNDLECFDDFLHRTIPCDKKREQDVNYDSIKAWKVVKRGNIRFRPTENLADHLFYDPRERIVFLFHRTEYLRAQMQLSSSMDLDTDFSESIQKGCLPPRLVSETLSTWHNVLFRPGDDKSDKLLQELISNRTNPLEYECAYSHSSIMEMPEHTGYQYWGKRLADLQRLSSRPEPNTPFFRYLERKATDRNALYVAILGLFLGALFGLLGFVVGIVQTVLAYQALKLSSCPCQKAHIISQ